MTNRPSDRPPPELPIYLREINQTPLLSPPEERALAVRVADGDAAARDHMVQANLRLVVSLARGYLGRGLSLDDLISEGNLGLMRAVEGFDAERGLRFSTYAAYWIKQSMRSAVMKQGKPVRLPAYMIVLLMKWRRAGASLAERLGRPPTPEEVGASLRLSKKKMSVVAQAIQVSSLLSRESDADDSRLVDERSGAVGGELTEIDEIDRLLRLLDELTEQEATVIRMRFGLGPYVAMTLREIGKSLGMTHESVRKVEKQALKRLMDLH